MSGEPNSVPVSAPLPIADVTPMPGAAPIPPINIPAPTPLEIKNSGVSKRDWIIVGVCIALFVGAIVYFNSKPVKPIKPADPV